MITPAFRPLVPTLLLVILASCYPVEKPVPAGVVVDLNDEATRRLYDLQHERAADSLLRYLVHPDPSRRYLAARAFGSFPKAEEMVLDSLALRLKDPNPDVRTAAAYALGQLGDAATANRLAGAFDTLGADNTYNAALLAAVGKTGGTTHLRQLTEVVSYRPTDTLLRSGQAWAYFYFGRRELFSPAANQWMLDRLIDEATPPAVRAPAAFYLQRFPVNVTPAESEALQELLRNSTDADVQMAAARTLGENRSPEAQVALIRTSRDAADWRVRTSAIQALADYDYAGVREPVVERLRDDHPLVRRIAANYLLSNGTPADATFYRQLARDSSVSDVRYRLLAAANRHLPLSFADQRGRINYELQRDYARSTDPYQRADILSALAEFPWNYRIIYELYQEASAPPVRSAAAAALETISGRKDFAAFFRGSSRRVRQDLGGYFREMILSGEVGPAYTAANALAADATDYAPLFPDTEWLATALRSMRLPRDIEAYRAVEGAAAALAGDSVPEPRSTAANVRPIDWQLIAEDGSDEVTIRTEAGRITLKLWPDQAPGTVSSFLQLVREGYFDGKVFHRVVPNFVAQGGGPLGDGFGAEDYSLRTETPGARYDRPGLIGMASAGKDTEGVQFFITHRPTPHLDGNYTIFGEVTAGQEVVDRLTVGSRIERIDLR